MAQRRRHPIFPNPYIYCFASSRTSTKTSFDFTGTSLGVSALSIEARKLKGFRDFLPVQARMRQRITDCMRRFAIEAGFQQIDTPALEYLDVLLGNDAGETEKEVYRFKDHGERDVGLRFDLTIPFARFVTEHYASLPLPFKKLQIGDVWRGEKPQKGRYRQFCQADVDIIGADSAVADFEIISCIYKTLAEFLPKSFTIRINHRAILSGLIHAELGAISALQESEVLIAIDKLAKIGADAVADVIHKQLGVNSDQCLRLIQRLVEIDSEDHTVWQQLIRDVQAKSPQLLADVQRVRDTMELISQITTSPQHRVICDLRIARGLGYYTGIVFETTIDDLKGFGSIASGGRYNDLVGRFGKYQLAGVGGSIGVDRLLAALEDMEAFEALPPVRVFVAIATEDAVSYAVGIASELRSAQISTDIATKLGKLGNQFKYADQAGATLVITVGTTEMQQERLRIKQLNTGTESADIPRNELLAKVLDLLMV
jgi:histidyl-tRNA synthetase